MNHETKVVVCSRSFSKNTVLVEELKKKFFNVKLNSEGLVLKDSSLIEFIGDADAVIVGLETINADILAGLPKLSVVSKYGVGFDQIDLQSLVDRNIRLGWTAGVNKRSVAELVIAFAISLLRMVPAANLEVREGKWAQKIGRYLSGKVVGVVGCGNVGKDLIRLLKPFNCEVLVHDVVEYPEFYAEFSVQPVELDELLRRSDVVTLHVPYNASTHMLLNRERMQLLKSESILINTARGGLVDEACLKESLVSGQLAAAGFDVFADEPPTDMELLVLPNMLATPHIGGSALEAVLAMGRAAIEGLENNASPRLGEYGQLEV